MDGHCGMYMGAPKLRHNVLFQMVNRMVLGQSGQRTSPKCAGIQA